MNISVILVNWNSKDYLQQCLASLFARCRIVDIEVIVVDAGSFDGCDEMLRREFPSVVFVQSRENIGYAGANNLGFRHARGRKLLFLNPDTELIENSIRVLARQLDSLPMAGIIGCRLLNKDFTLQTSCVQSFPTVLNQALDSEYLRQRFRRSPLWGMAALYSGKTEPTEVEALSGACIFVTRECFEQIDGFTESYFMYGEDLDLCFKARRSGHKVYHVPETSVIHYGGGSTKKAVNNFSTVMMRESVYRFLRINHGIFSARAYRLSTMIAAVGRLLLIGPMMVLGDKVVRHGIGSWKKWNSILGWSLGIEPTARPRSTKRASDILREIKTS
ncbi:MAG TPA: glycosyltransferase family 2 protein [Opitutaceae bacterium]|nr:glycosyltransferase family 2 protein [Opitutaceae bacterium]